MKTLRTPDERFEGLDGYPFEPHYAEIADGDGGTLRVHYLDEGPADAAPVLRLEVVAPTALAKLLSDGLDLGRVNRL